MSSKNRKDTMTTTAVIEAPAEKRTKKVSEYLKYTFSDAEILTLSKTLAKHNQDLGELEAQKKRIMADFGAKIQAEEANIGTLARKVSTGSEYRDIECLVTFHEPTQGKKTFVRLDTGEQVKTELMSSGELQESLKFDADEEASGDDEQTEGEEEN